jgi:starch-binding outer membrane protein, SusD/RagB family
LQTPATEQYVAIDFADKVALVKAILLERRIELLAEGKRWGDISRNVMDANYTTGGIPAKAINGANGLAIYNCGSAYTPGQAAIPVTDFKFIWPIPANEIIQNPIIAQNPNY